jgi:cellulose synthase/poly-beta-1,6-N-acetylglucosamine synthase-like glycosyltransferase
MISNKIEDKLTLVQRHSNWDQQDEARAYNQCLTNVLAEENGRAWADGNIRVGDYILLIDCDTRVPVDCLLDAVSEMEQSPNVGILQYSSGVMQITTSFFESG